MGVPSDQGISTSLRNTLTNGCVILREPTEGGSVSTTDSPTWQEVRDSWITAQAAHLAIREVLPREHPDRLRSKANYVEAQDAWRAIYKSN